MSLRQMEASIDVNLFFIYKLNNIISHGRR